MHPLIRRTFLLVTVFLTGACILVVEVVATRILSPYFGNTIFSVSSVISVVLGALSIGYYLGGKLSDRHPSLQWFFGLITLSSLVLFLLHVLGQAVLPKLAMNLPLTTGPLIVSTLLFFIPCLVLGTLSPFAIKLQQTLTPEQGIGSISGTMFFWSTLGSILGSLATGFTLIPHFGINHIVIGVSGLLFLIGFIPLVVLRFKPVLLMVTIVTVITVGVSTQPLLAKSSRFVYESDGVYEHLRILDVEQQGRPTRVLLQDTTNSGAMFLDSEEPTDLVYGYTTYIKLIEGREDSIKNVLVIGGGPYTIPKYLLATLANAQIDVVDIEPSLGHLAETYFGLKPNPRLTTIIQDGRRYLTETDQSYDLIFADAYGSLHSVPSHLLTQEFFQIARAHLSDQGMFIGNFIGDTYPNGPSLIFSAMNTFASVFEHTAYFGVDSATRPEAQNILFVATNDATPLHPTFIDTTTHQIDPNRFDLTPHPILTDDFAPTEFFSSHTLRRLSNTRSN